MTTTDTLKTILSKTVHMSYCALRDKSPATTSSLRFCALGMVEWNDISDEQKQEIISSGLATRVGLHEETRRTLYDLMESDEI